ncbi:MAG TPA: phospholipid carrier-dependent glycosyltransferase [Smithella sp.]|nr:phospholipid carrier-dependent glycosyltransferase [Smithella sp.]
MATDNKRVFYNLSATVICIAILILLAIEFILNLTPPIARDAVIHHLAIPKLWLKNGGFYDVKWADFSYYPMNVDLLYLLPLYFKRDFIANFIHMGFGIGTALLIYQYLNNKMGRIAGILGILVFLSTPIVVRLSTQAYVDLGLAFFTTASILAFIRYRDSEFKEFKWLFLSSLAMGLALGTKYNALIVWFFLSLAVVYVYSKDTGRQGRAVIYGLIFFMISLFVFSPWLIKNIILTGNPLFPLFKGLFNTESATAHGGALSIVSKDSHTGFFQMREMLYGEKFWEILIIPIRFFFQGQDNSDRFFDGVLNPVLILLSPFALMNKSNSRDKLFFMSFAVFFILITFFLGELRIRYIMPVVPVLSILTVMGFINIWNWTKIPSTVSKNILTVLVFSFFIMMMGKNVFYIKDYYQTVGPMNYVLGKESKDEFITRHNSSYPAIKYINTHSPVNARVRLIFLAQRGYYLDRIYQDDPSFGMDEIRGLVENSHDERSFRTYLNSLGFTYLLVRTDLYLKYLQDNYPPETVNRFLKQMGQATEMIYHDNVYAVYRLIPPG